MDLIRKEDLLPLAQHEGGPCISIFISTHRSTKETLGNPTRLKNQLREAEQKLSERNLRSKEIRELLEPFHTLLDRFDFWQHQSDGLALFRSPDTFLFYRLPISFHELTVVGDRFHTKPLIRLFTGDGRFFILAISQQSVRLLSGTRYTVDELQVPAGVNDLVLVSGKVPARARALQHHAGGPAIGGGPPAMFHGHGGASEEVKEHLEGYLREVDKELQEILHDETAPLVFAGVDYLFPIYKEVTRYNNLAPRAVTGNVDELSPEELHKKALEIVLPIFEKAEQEAAANYPEAVRRGHASKDIREVVPAAHHGRVQTLFVPDGVQRWGSYDPATAIAEPHDWPQPSDDDLVDLAAIQTVIHGGEVFVVDPKELPDLGPAVALYRY